MLLIKNAQGINDAPVEKHGVICNRRLPVAVAGDIPLKHLVAAAIFVLLTLCTNEVV